MKKILILSLLTCLLLTGCGVSQPQIPVRNEPISYGRSYHSTNGSMPYEAKINLSGSSFYMSGVNSASEVTGTAITMGNRVVMETENGSGQRYVFEKRNEDLRFVAEESSSEARNILPENVIFSPDYNN